jgi:hypothetical protein
MTTLYSPSYEITPTIVDLVERIGESLGWIMAQNKLRKKRKHEKVNARIQE